MELRHIGEQERWALENICTVRTCSAHHSTGTCDKWRGDSETRVWLFIHNLCMFYPHQIFTVLREYVQKGWVFFVYFVFYISVCIWFNPLFPRRYFRFSTDNSLKTLSYLVFSQLGVHRSQFSSRSMVFKVAKFCFWQILIGSEKSENIVTKLNTDMTWLAGQSALSQQSKRGQRLIFRPLQR